MLENVEPNRAQPALLYPVWFDEGSVGAARVVWKNHVPTIMNVYKKRYDEINVFHLNY